MRLAPALLLSCQLVAAGCSSSSLSQGPNDTLRAYARALEEKRVEDAYSLLSEEARRAIPLDAFRRMVLENPEDVIEVARALARPSGTPEVHATVTLPNGEELRLLFEDGRWRVDAAAVDLYGQQTPRQTLLGFLRAYEKKRYDVILRYVPDADREAVSSEAPPSASDKAAPDPAPAEGAPSPTEPAPAPTAFGELTADKLRVAWEGPQKEEMVRIVVALRAALPSATIEETGDVASMAYGSGRTVSFVRERGAWKIRDF